jgi:nucleoside-diphosphate-sugar epimerase
MATVLVTGGSGFLGEHVILALLAAGHDVHATVRSLDREPQVRAALKVGGAEPGDRLRFHRADLERDDGWAEAAAGCDYVQHVASPFPAVQPADAQELIRPAREGALRVLRAARDAGVKRVVLTSSVAAVSYGLPPRDAPFTEADWTDPDAPGVAPYMQSKTLAERAAWDFVAGEGNGMELAVVNPVGIFGPALDRDTSTSMQIFVAMMNGATPALPRIHFGLVDARDVADLQLRCMTAPAAAGERFIAVAGPDMAAIEVARVLRARLGSAAARVPTRTLPDWLVRAMALVNPTARAVVPNLGARRAVTAEKARRVLGWSPRSNEEVIVATAESLIALGMVKG